MLKHALLMIMLASPVAADMYKDTPRYVPLPKADFSGRSSAGWLQAPGWDGVSANRDGYLTTPGASGEGFLATPGTGQVGEEGFLSTPGRFVYQGSDGFLPTPGGRNSPDQVIASTDEGKTVAMFANKNLGPYLIPRWAKAEGELAQTLWQDTGAPTAVFATHTGLRDADLPSPHGALPELYQPTSLYDHTYTTRDGKTVYFDPKTREGHIRTEDAYKKAPAWVSAIARDGGNWIWGQPVVVDGDAFMLEGWPVRLTGIDAPETEQMCSNGAVAIACGTESKDALASMIEHLTVACDVHHLDEANRLVATCNTPDFQINGTLIARGWAVPWKAPNRYMGMAQRAKDHGRGLWALTFQHPQDWREGRPRPAEHRDPKKRLVLGPHGEMVNDQERFPFIPFGMSPQERPETLYLPRRRD